MSTSARPDPSPNQPDPMGGTPANSEPPPPADQDWLATCPLTDGRIVRFRHVSPDDQPLITEGIRTASRETLLHRFFSPIRSVAPDMLRGMLAIDRTQGMCVVGVVEENGVNRIICGARYVRLPEPGRAEIAFTVHDDYQHRGLGTFLLKLLAKLAGPEGIRWFEADVMNSNQKMLNLFRKVVPGLTKQRRMGDVQHVMFEVSMVPFSEP